MMAHDFAVFAAGTLFGVIACIGALGAVLVFGGADTSHGESGEG